MWTILASSMLAANMPNTSPPSTANTTSACTIGMVNGILAWTSTGITRDELPISPCLTMSPKRSHVFNVHLHASLNTNRTPMSTQPTAQNLSTQKTLTHPRHSTKRAKNTSERSSALFSTTHAALTVPCYRLLDPLPHNRQIQRKTPKKLVHQFLHYATTHPDTIITYQASNMVLAGHSNASYLLETNARSRAGGHFFMSNNDAIPSNNGAILTISQIIKAVKSSMAEAEIGALYINCREAIPAWHTLEYLGHKQPPTPMQTDNTTALGVVNNNVKKQIKGMDMKYHWLRCRINQHQFRHYWAAGKSNNGDYIT
jgi:hypothetical protein